QDKRTCAMGIGSMAIAMYGNKKIRIGLICNFAPYVKIHKSIVLSGVYDLDIRMLLQDLAHLQYYIQGNTLFQITISQVPGIVSSMSGIQNNNKFIIVALFCIIFVERCERAGQHQ